MIIALVILALIVFYLVGFYNSAKTALVHIGASIQEIGNQLKRQADLIPNLVDSAKSYLKHERDIFDKLTDARKMVDKALASREPKSIDKAQNLINDALKSFSVIVESNPQIQASGVVSNLMDELRDTADKIMYSRRTLIDLTADYNIKISTIPGLWLASLFNFQPQKGLETPTEGQHITVSESDTATPKVKLD